MTTAKRKHSDALCETFGQPSKQTRASWIDWQNFVCLPAAGGIGISVCRYCNGEMRQDKHGGWVGWCDATGERNFCPTLTDIAFR